MTTWYSIYNDFTMFKTMIKCTHLPFMDWFYEDDTMKKKLMDDVCKFWYVIKPFIEEKFGDMDHPKTLYIYNEEDTINGLSATDKEND